MRQITQWLCARLPRAVLVVALLGVLTSVMTLFAILAAAIIVLVCQQRGVAEALVVAASGAGVLAAAGLVSSGSVDSVQLSLLWWPALGLGIVLRKYGSLSLSFQVGAVAALAVVAGFFVWFGDPATFWRPWAEALASSFVQAGILDAALAEAWKNSVLLLLSGLVVAGGFCFALLGVFLGYHWWLSLQGVGDFGREFRQLRAGMVLAGVAALVATGAFFTASALLLNLSAVFAAVFFIQGLAVAHRVFAARGWQSAWLIPLYVLVLLPLVPLLQTALSALLVTGGYLDNWFAIGPRTRGAG